MKFPKIIYTVLSIIPFPFIWIGLMGYFEKLFKTIVFYGLSEKHIYYANANFYGSGLYFMLAYFSVYGLGLLCLLLSLGNRLDGRKKAAKILLIIGLVCIALFLLVFFSEYREVRNLVIPEIF